MDELISREAALDICQKEYEERLQMSDYCGDTVAWNIAGEIKALPAVDAAPVVHGRLVSTGYDELYCEFGNCTVCGADNPTANKYCGLCGARMDLPEPPEEEDQGFM